MTYIIKGMMNDSVLYYFLYDQTMKIMPAQRTGLGTNRVFSMKKNKITIIGLGNIGIEIIKRLSREFEIFCIDLTPDPAEILSTIRKDARFLQGDATSRLVLEEAGVGDSDVVIITTNNEKVNIEVATLLKEHFQIDRIISVGITKQGIERLEELGIEVESLFMAAAIDIRNRLEQYSRAAHAIGLGKDEILEVEVHPDSKLANKPIGALAPIRWKIGLIYRDNNIIIPRKDVRLKPRDRVIILGDPAVLKTVSEILTFNFQQFPMEYGTTAIAYLTGDEDYSFIDEIDYIFSVFPLKRIVFSCSKKAENNPGLLDYIREKDHIKDHDFINSILPPENAIYHAIDETRNEQGLIILSRHTLIDSRKHFVFSIGKKDFLHGISSYSYSPVLLCAGSFPYNRTIVPCTGSINLQHSLETAIEISLSLHNDVSAVLVEPSEYISSDADMALFNEIKKTVNEVSLMYKKSIDTVTLKGNPVKVITNAFNEYNLFINDISGMKRQGFITALLNP
ncbi:MAG TPA: TrkA family potassium uptake protein, partial [Nitrospirae bacterium]|nr:TrkA family potassium uptake protein [Nitrospirota bacterium]